jgi:hypothetical protein
VVSMLYGLIIWVDHLALISRQTGPTFCLTAAGIAPLELRPQGFNCELLAD